MRIKNQKQNKEAFINTQKQVYNSLTAFLKTNINEQTKSKAKIIQSKCLDFFKQQKLPTTNQVQALLSILKEKYIQAYPITLSYDTINSIDDEKAMYFNVYLNFGEWYKRIIVQSNEQPQIDGKDVILNIELGEKEMSEILKEKTLTGGGFEEI